MASPPGGVGPGPCPSLSPSAVCSPQGVVSGGAHLSVRYLQVRSEVTHLGGPNGGPHYALERDGAGVCVHIGAFLGVPGVSAISKVSLLSLLLGHLNRKRFNP